MTDTTPVDVRAIREDRAEKMARGAVPETELKRARGVVRHWAEMHDTDGVLDEDYEDLAIAIAKEYRSSPPGGVDGELLAAFKRLYRGYVNTLETGRDRILALGGHCDPVDRMEESDPVLRAARAAIAKAEATPRTCTCHPDERPAVCQQKYALSECLAAATPAAEGERERKAELAEDAARIVDRSELFGRIETRDMLLEYATLLRSPAPAVGEEALQALKIAVNYIDATKHQTAHAIVSGALARLTTEQRGNG